MDIQEVLLHAEQGIAGNDLIVKVGQRFDQRDIVLIHDERKPEAQLSDFYSAGVDVHAIEAVLNGVPLELVGGTVAHVVEVGCESGASADNLLHHAHGECTGTDGGVAHGKGGQFFVEVTGVDFNVLGEFSLVTRALQTGGFVGGCLSARVNEDLDLFSRHRHSVAIDRCIEVVDQAFLTHVVDDLTSRVERPFRLALLHIEQLFEHLAQHFWVDRHFRFQRLRLVDGEVVAVKHVENARADVSDLGAVLVRKPFVRNIDVRVAPVIIAGRFKEATIKERDAAVEGLTPRLMPTIRRQCVVKDRFKDVVEHVLVVAESTVEQLTQKITRTAAPRAVLGHTQPALLLQEVKKDNLPQQLLGKVGGVDVRGGKCRANGLVFLHEAVEFVFEVKEQRLVLLEELLRDRFDAKGILNLCQ